MGNFFVGVDFYLKGVWCRMFKNNNNIVSYFYFNNNLKSNNNNIN